MTYFGFLLLFLGIPILLLLGLTWLDHRRGIVRPTALGQYNALWVLLLHVVIAVVYTTPWDNYLVATSVWWYDPELVTGITIGWVPIEEYTFFVVQPIMTGLWLLYLARRWRRPPATQAEWERPLLRKGSVAVVGIIWLAMFIMLLSGWDPGTYLSLQLAWALPPIMLQLVYGADILWHYRRLVLLAIGIPTLYLAIADAIAINAGTWTIDPAQSLHWLIGGVLPLEEFLFFLLTNTLLVFGMTLVLAAEGQVRLQQVREMLNRRRQVRTTANDSTTP